MPLRSERKSRTPLLSTRNCRSRRLSLLILKAASNSASQGVYGKPHKPACVSTNIKHGNGQVDRGTGQVGGADYIRRRVGGSMVEPNRTGTIEHWQSQRHPTKLLFTLLQKGRAFRGGVGYTHVWNGVGLRVTIGGNRECQHVLSASLGYGRTYYCCGCLADCENRTPIKPAASGQSRNDSAALARARLGQGLVSAHADQNADQEVSRPQAHYGVSELEIPPGRRQPRKAAREIVDGIAAEAAADGSPDADGDVVGDERVEPSHMTAWTPPDDGCERPSSAASRQSRRSRRVGSTDSRACTGRRRMGNRG